MGGRKICLWRWKDGRIMKGNIVRNEERFVMRYNSVLDLHTHTVASGLLIVL